MVFNSAPLVGQPRSFQKSMKILKKENVKKKKRKENQHSKNPKPNRKASHKRKRKKIKEKKGRGETEKVRDPSCYPVPTPPSAIAYPNRRPILLQLLVAQFALPSSVSLLHYSSLHSSQEFNLSFPSKLNIMFVNLACCSVVCLLNIAVKQFTLTN